MPIKILRRVLEHREMTMVLLFQREISSAVVKDLRFENKDKDFLRQQQHWATVKNGLLTYLHTYIDLSVIIWHQ